jgi:N-methylhydantoinase B
MADRSPIDPITLEVVVEGLMAIVREMRVAVRNTAYSSAIYEMEDFSCALFDPHGRMIAQSEDHPGHVIPMPWSVRCALEDWGADLAPGDIVMLNDPYRGGTHLNDVTLLYPVFLGDELFVFPAVREHWADVGGPNPGSMSGLASSIFQEGLRIPPIKICERGQLNRSLLTLLFANMRLPDERQGDFHAAIAACKTAERRIRAMVERYGRDTVLAGIAQNLDRSEARMRAAIAALPDGTYEYEDYLEYFRAGRLDPVIVRLALTVRGDELVADFTGSSPQVPAAVNSTLAVTAAGVFTTVKAVLDPSGPINDGTFRPITVTAPPGTIVNVQPDAPAGAHGEIRKRAVSVTLGALAQVVPERVAGDVCGTSFHNMLGGIHPRTGRSFVYYEAPPGGNGGLRDTDGPSAMGNVDFGNLKMILPAEALEIEFPLLIERSALREDSAGDGARRGGLGYRREARLLAPEGTYSVMSDRAVVPPFGVCGGMAAAPTRATVQRDGVALPDPTPGKLYGQPLLANDVVIMEAAGGGGYGDPLTRDPELVARDVRLGYISRARAQARYGVVLRADGTVDAAATAAARARLAAARVVLPVIADERDPYRGVLGRHRVVRLGPAALARLGVAPEDAADTLVELLGRHAAPLRAWLLPDDAAGAALPLDARARRILGISPGDTVEVRVLGRTVPLASA